MIQFSLNRFGKLARWSLTCDKRYYVKSFLQGFVIMLLGFLFFPKMNSSGNHSSGYAMSSIMVVVMFLVTIVLGSSFMFYSMDNDHDRQNLMMLPASNFEKYLIRYATWIFLIPLYLVAFFAADVLQYVIHWVLGHDYVVFMTSVLTDNVSDSWNAIPQYSQQRLARGLVILALWMHSFYALGATFFRSRKYNWMSTTLVLILGFTFLTVSLTWPYVNQTWWNYNGYSNWLFLLWTLLNFWLSYKFFCRMQVIGKYINL